MTRTAQSAPSSPVRRIRTAVAAVAGIIAVLGFTAATIGVWANRTIYDTDTFSDTVSDVLEQPEVTDALATYLTEAALRVVPVERTLDDVLPGKLDKAAPEVTDKIGDAVHRQFVTLLANPKTQGHIVGLVRSSHATLVNTIDTGGIANLELQGNAITLNLLPVVVDGLDALPSGLLTRRLQLPELAYGGNHAVQVQKVSDATKVDLPPDFGLVTVYQGDAVEHAGFALAETQRAVVDFHRALTTIIIVTLLTLVIALVAAVRRGRAIAGLFAGGAVTFLVATLMIRAAVRQAPAVSTDPANQAIIGAVTRSVFSGLTRLLDIGVIVGLVVAGAVGILEFLRRAGRHGEAA